MITSEHVDYKFDKRTETFSEKNPKKVLQVKS